MRKLQEQITGNTAMVFHGSEEREVYRALCEGKWKSFSGVYGKGLYSVYNLNDNATSKGHYGEYILKLYVRDLSKYWCFDWDNFQKVHPIWAKHTNEDDFIDYQAEKFKLKQDTYPEDLGKLYDNYRHYPKFLETVDGIIYHGTQDGDCILHYNPYNCRPVAISDDTGETWEKIDEEYIQDYKYNLSDPEVNKSFYKKTNFNFTLEKIKDFCKTTVIKYGLKNDSFYGDVYFEHFQDSVADLINVYFEDVYFDYSSPKAIDNIISCLMMDTRDKLIHAIYENEKIPKDLRDLLLFNYSIERDSFYENINQISINKNHYNHINIYKYDIYGITFFEIYNQYFSYVVCDILKEYEYIYSLFQYDCINNTLAKHQVSVDKLEEFLIKLHDIQFFDSEDEYTNIIKSLKYQGFLDIYTVVNNNIYSTFKDYLNSLIEDSIDHLTLFFDDFNIKKDDIQYILDNSDLSIVDILEANSNKDQSSQSKFSFMFLRIPSFWFKKSDKYLIFYPLQKCKFELPLSYFYNNEDSLGDISCIISNFINEKGPQYLNEQRFKKLINIFSYIINHKGEIDFDIIKDLVLESNFTPLSEHGMHNTYSVKQAINKMFNFIKCFDDITEKLKFNQSLLKKISLHIIDDDLFKSSKEKMFNYINNNANISLGELMELA